MSDQFSKPRIGFSRVVTPVLAVVVATVLVIVVIRAVSGAYPPLWVCAAVTGAHSAGAVVGMLLARAVERW